MTNEKLIKAFSAAAMLAGAACLQADDGAAKATMKFVESESWKPVDMSDVLVKEGSALDFRAATASKLDAKGLLPRLCASPSGKIVAEGGDGTPVRLKGYTFGTWPFGVKVTKPDIELQFKQARIQGCNLVRFFNVDAITPKQDMTVDPDWLDRADWLLHQAGRNGVYVHMVVSAYHLYFKQGSDFTKKVNDAKARAYAGDPKLREAWKFGATFLLNHVNPYNGLAWKDDPAIACLEFFNEQEWGLVGAGASPDTIKLFSEKFRAWLEAEYKSPAALAKAWSDASISSFEQVEAPAKLLVGIGSSPRDKAFLRFCNKLAREEAEWFESVVRDLGYKGLTAQGNFPFWPWILEARYETSQVALANAYYAHPEPPALKVNPWGSKCPVGSSIGNGNAWYWFASNATRFADRPFIQTEYNHSFWNSYQHEGGIVFGSYAGFQGFDGIVVHDRGRSMLKVETPTDSFNIDSNPVARANEFLVTCLYLRGDVKGFSKRVEMELSPAQVENCQRPSRGELGFICGFSISFPSAKSYPGVAKTQAPGMRLASSLDSGKVEVQEWAASSSGSRPDSSLDGIVEMLKGKGLLPKSNISMPSQGVFQSDSGEMTMRTKENLLKVATLKTEAVTLEAGKGEPVGLLEVASTDIPACVAACSIDGSALKDSKRIVFIYSTRAANSEMELSADGVELLNLGKLPILMKTGRLEASLKLSNAKSLSLYALGMDGSRKEKLPVSVDDGKLKISLDTAKLKNGPTPFFELLAE